MPSEVTAANRNNFEDNHQKGRLFEEFIVRHFDNHHFDLVEWRSDKRIGNFIPLSSKNPDLVFRYKWTINDHFAIECKYRNSIGKEICLKDEHLISYLNYQQKTLMPVYIALGTGEKPDQPDQVFLIPLEKFRVNNPLPAFGLNNYRHATGYDNFYWDPVNRTLK